MADPLGGITGMAAKILAALKAGSKVKTTMPTSSLTGDAAKLITALKAGGKTTSSIIPWLTALLPQVVSKIPATAAVVGTGIGAYQGAKKIGQMIYPNDPYAMGSFTGMPDPALFYKQQGGAQMTPQGAQAYQGIYGEPPAPYQVSGQGGVAKYQADLQAATAAKQQTLAEEEAQRRQAEESMNFPMGAPPAGYRYVWDSSSMRYVLEPSTGLTPQGRQPYSSYGVNPYDNPDTSQAEGQFNPNTGQWEPPANYITPQQQWERDEAQRQQAWQQQQWQQQMAWNREQQAAQLAAEKEQRLATLKANPASWLEYAALANQPAAIQPWMLPLMPQQYQGMQAGATLPGWTGSAEAQNLAQLTTPSAQYMARMSPASKQQFYGYERARTGSPAEDTQWRMWNQAPPGGSFGGLNYNR